MPATAMPQAYSILDCPCNARLTAYICILHTKKDATHGPVPGNVRDLTPVYHTALKSPLNLSSMSLYELNPHFYRAYQ